MISPSLISKPNSFPRRLEPGLLQVSRCLRKRRRPTTRSPLRFDNPSEPLRQSRNLDRQMRRRSSALPPLRNSPRPARQNDQTAAEACPSLLSPCLVPVYRWAVQEAEVSLDPDLLEGVDISLDDPPITYSDPASFSDLLVAAACLFMIDRLIVFSQTANVVLLGYHGHRQMDHCIPCGQKASETRCGRSRAKRFASAWSRCSSAPGERESGQQQQDPSEADDGSMEGGCDEMGHGGVI